jgi:hypothetical protein
VARVAEKDDEAPSPTALVRNTGTYLYSTLRIEGRKTSEMGMNPASVSASACACVEGYVDV